MDPSYNLRNDIRWNELFDRYLTDWPALATLGALAWRQAALVAQTDEAMASNLNSWSISGICYYLDMHGIRPDDFTMQWALAQEGAAPAPIRVRS